MENVYSNSNPHLQNPDPKWMDPVFYERIRAKVSKNGLFFLISNCQFFVLNTLVFSPLNQFSYIETIFFADRLAQNHCVWSLGRFLCRDQEINGQLLNPPVPRMALAEFVVLRIRFRDLLLGQRVSGNVKRADSHCQAFKEMSNLKCNLKTAFWCPHAHMLFIYSHALYLKCVIYFYRV